MEIKVVGCNIDLENSIGDGNGTPESICAAYGRVSRSVKSLEELRFDACVDIEKARISNKKIVFEYGHNSIAEHAVLNFDISGISRLAVETLEHHRLVSFTEKSQRYCSWKDSSFYNFCGEEITKEDQQQYYNHVKKCFALYEKLLNNNILGEDARYVLPLSTTTSLGMTINARNLEYMIQNLVVNELSEVKELGWRLYKEALSIIPSLVKFRPTFQGNNCNKKMIEFLNQEHGENKFSIQQLTNMLICPTFKDTRVSLCDFTLDMDSVISSTHSMHIQGIPLASYGIVLKEFYSILFDFMDEHTSVPRSFEIGNLYFILNLSATAFAQLKRHRMCTILPSPYWIRIYDFSNYIIPDSIKAANKNLVLEVYDLLEDTQNLYDEWLVKYSNNSKICDYLLLNANTRFCQVSMNMRSFYHFSRLRCDVHAQTEIRNIAKEMVKQVKEVAPLSGAMLGGKSDFSKIIQHTKWELE